MVLTIRPKTPESIISLAYPIAMSTPEGKTEQRPIDSVSHLQHDWSLPILQAHDRLYPLLLGHSSELLSLSE